MRSPHYLFEATDQDLFENQKFGKMHCQWRLPAKCIEMLSSSISTEDLIHMAQGSWGDIRVAISRSPSIAQSELLEIERLSPSAEVLKLLLERGYSLVANNIQEKSAFISKICDQLSCQFMGATNCNAYTTPPNSQALNQHYDDHDVFVVQIRGYKKWQITCPTETLEPIPGMAYCEEINKTAKATTSYIMEPGCVLYVPAGVPHQAFTGDEESTHLSFSLQPPRIKDFFKSILENLCLERYEGKYLRKRLQAKDIQECILSDELLINTKKALNNLLSQMHNQSNRALFIEQMGRTLCNEKPANPLANLLFNEQSIDESTMIVKKPHTLLIGPTNDLHMYFPGGRLSIEKGDLPIAKIIQQGAIIKVGNLPGVSSKDKIQFAIDMISSGLMTICGSADSQPIKHELFDNEP